MALTLDDARLTFTGAGWSNAARMGDSPPADSNGNIFTNASHHNVASPVYPVGTIVEIVDSTTGTPALFRYMQMGTADTGNAVAAKSIMGLQITANEWDGKLTNDASAGMIGGPCLIGLAAITNDYYGWWFQAGQVPVGTVSGLDGTYVTDGTAALATPALMIGAGAAMFDFMLQAGGGLAVVLTSATD